MKKIQKNLNAIERKFLSLKATHRLYDQPTSIGEVAEAITYGTIQKSQVQDYIQYVNNSPQVKANQKINEKWYELQLEQMINFLDRVLQHRNNNKSKQSPQRSALSQKKIKIKLATNQVHQNPYIPKKIAVPSGAIIETSPKQQQNITVQNCLNNKPSVEQIQMGQDKQLQQKQITSPKSQIKAKDIGLDLPQDFQDLPVKQKYSILSKKFGKDKSILEKKFDLIYKHYRKQMYIPFQSFQLNNQLLMDMRIFLKYYKDFQLPKRFKTNQAMKNFKKIALNGLWLDDKMFNELHYRLVELLQINQQILKEQNQQGQTIQNDQKQIQTKKEISKNLKNLVQNILKLKELSVLVSEQKINYMFNNNLVKNHVKKIVEAHSGLTKDDVMLKLQERVQQRKLRKNLLSGNYNLQKFGQMSIGKLNSSPAKILQDPIQRLSPHQLSIYQELEIPKLRSRQLKKSSIYSSLQILDMHKEKQKLKLLVNERDKEQYLDAYFKKEKHINSLPRSYSLSLSRSPTENEESTNNFSLKSVRFANSFNQDNIFQRNLSLPRMKFT